MGTRRAHRGSSTTRLTRFTKPLSTSPPPALTPPRPLTPPSSEQGSSTQKSRTVLQDIIREIENRKIGRGLTDTPWLCFELPPIVYEYWEQQYQNDGFVQDKLRYDYFPSISRFVLRMPCLLHDQLAADIADHLHWQLKSIASGAGPAATFAENIAPTSTATIEFIIPGDTKHSPDASFKHIQAKYPGVVIEVSYSQKRQDIPRLAYDYITRSSGSIRVVVGIDLEYRGKMATLSVWRPQIRVNRAGKKRVFIHRTLSNQEIRSENGIPNNDTQTGLRLHLKDFGPRVLAGPAATLDEELFTSSATLSKYLSKAELADSTFRGTGQMVDFETEYDAVEMESDADILSQESTLPEHLNEDDELRFQRDEERNKERAERSDPSYLLDDS